jgi:PAS domain S-box-containing protein
MPAVVEWQGATDVVGVLEALNEAVLILDDRRRIVFVNECLTELTGFRREDVVGRSALEFYQHGAVEFLVSQMDRSRAAGRNRYEFFVPTAGGGRVPVVISARWIGVAEGRPLAVVTMTDIRAQKRVEADLRVACEELRKRADAVEAELRLATRVQHSLMPKAVVCGPVAVEAFYQPARTIGGDFGLAAVLPDGALRLLVCDVTGHGLSSALIANRIYAETMSLLSRRLDVDETLRELNAFVVNQIQEPGFYFTMTLGRLNRRGTSLRLASGGHPPALWVGPGREVRRIEPRGALLGVLDDAVPDGAMDEIPLASRDRVVLYTDGFCEVFNADGEELGIDGLEEIVRRHAAHPAAEMRDRIVADVEQWRDGPQVDDMSLIVLERR